MHQVREGVSAAIGQTVGSEGESTATMATPPENHPAARRRGLAAIGDLFSRTKVGDLTAVVVGLVAILAVAVTAIAILHSSAESVVSVAGGAFGVIGSVVGAYFGVKVGAD